jgi:predicted DNA-binding protein
MTEIELLKQTKGGSYMFYTSEPIQQKVSMSIHLTEKQKNRLKAISGELGIPVSVLFGLLIRHFINSVFKGTLTFDVIVKSYQKLQNGISEKKTCKITMRLKGEEFQEFSKVASQWLYLPGALARILVELLIVNIIDVNSIWNIQITHPTVLMQRHQNGSKIA